MAETRFGGSSPVARYWLAHCEGFVVRGGARGVVEELIRDADPFVTTRLVVRTRGRRREIVAAASVASVDPAERVLVVQERRTTRSDRNLRAAAPALRRRLAPAVATARSSAAAGAAAVANAPAAAERVGRALEPAVAAGATAVGNVSEVAARAWRALEPAVAGAAARLRRELTPAVRYLARSFRLLLAEAAATIRTLPTPRRASKR